MKLALRDYQESAFQQARELIRQGRRRILIVAPTGSGKTVLASALMEMTAAKGNRATFTVDRLSLVGQTSAMFDRYGIGHGVIQSQHPRFRLYEPVQVCSVQTLAKRGWPDSQLDVFDEAHVLHACHKRRLAETEGVVIGLTATPFTRGLGKYFDALVNVTTTRALIDSGWLSKYRIFACVEPDMQGVRVKSTGEWEEGETSSRARKIVGDVVGEYLNHGQGRKFICSAVDTNHVEELATKFRESGIPVATYTYRDKEQDRADTVSEFRKPDSDIRGLITVTAASRGFDVPDVSCIIIARPLRKSLAEHIQLIGRGLRIAEGKENCIARGTLILTDRGEVPIESVTLDHKVWDGVRFVSHAGAVCRGVQRVIEYDGIIATPDHEVFTHDGFERIEDAARGKRRIARTGIDGRPVRLADYLLANGAGNKFQVARGSALRSLWWNALRLVSQFAEATRNSRMPSLQCAYAGHGSELAVPTLPSADGSLHKREKQAVCGLRRSWDSLQFFIGERRGSMDRRESRDSRQSDAIGSHQQRWPLRAWQSPMDCATPEHEQFPQGGRFNASPIRSVQIEASGYPLCRSDAPSAYEANERRGNCRAIQAPELQTEREVWDILNAGPLQRFTANGRLVHNCLILDHAGNCQRFFEACESFFDAGQSELDDGVKKERKAQEKKGEREPVKCPVCRCVHAPAPACPNCGHQYPRKQAIQHVAGELIELDGNKRNRETQWADKVRWMRSLAGIANERGYAPGWAAHKYRERFGVWPNDPRVHAVAPKAPDFDVIGWVRSRQIAYAKRRNAA